LTIIVPLWAWVDLQPSGRHDPKDAKCFIDTDRRVFSLAAMGAASALEGRPRPAMVLVPLVVLEILETLQ
jgi:hypothetical protein